MQREEHTGRAVGVTGPDGDGVPVAVHFNGDSAVLTETEDVLCRESGGDLEELVAVEEATDCGIEDGLSSGGTDLGIKGEESGYTTLKANMSF